MVIVGAPIKVNPASDALPPGVVRLTAPVAPVPTLATIDVEETTVNDVTGIPPNVIFEVPVKLVPVMPNEIVKLAALLKTTSSYCPA